MLFSPAVCVSCGGVFASGVVVAERRGDPVSYRGSAGPCPRCGGRGRIPGWIFSFHAAAVAAREQAAAADNTAVLDAVRRCSPGDLDGPGRRAFSTEMTGAWRGVAVQLGRIPADEWQAAIAMLGPMLDDHEEPSDPDPGRVIRASAGPGTRDAERSPRSA